MTNRDNKSSRDLTVTGHAKGQGLNPNRRRRSGERGNVFFTLFGAVAVVGVLGAGIMATMRGPLSTMVEINRIEEAKAEMRLTMRLILAEATKTPSPDSTPDSLTEPPPPVIVNCDAGSTAGQGCIPSTIGSDKNDPWGTPYRYCAWNQGSDNDSEGKWLAGSANTNDLVIAVISAGSDRQFHADSTCRDASATPAFVNTRASGDDHIVAMQYVEAISGSGGMWAVDTTDSTIANISDSNIDELDLSGATGASGNSVQLKLGAASMLLPDENDIDNQDCIDTSANDGLLRLNSATMSVEVCDHPTGFKSSGSVWIKTGNDISYTAGKVTAGNALDVTGATTLTGTLTVSGTNATELGGALDVTGATTLSGTLTVSGANATELGGTLDVTGNATLDGTLDVTGATTLSSTLDVSGDISGGTDNMVMIQDSLDVSGNINTGDHYRLDGAKMLSNDTIASNILLGNVDSTTPGITANYMNLGDAIHADLVNKRVGIGFADAYDVSSLTDALTVFGDISATGIKIAPNTSGNILVNDGTSFKSVEAGGDIASVLIVSGEGRFTIADDAITNAKIADDAVDTMEIKNGAVTAAKLSDTGADGECLKLTGGALSWDVCGTGSGTGGTNTIREVLLAGNNAQNEDLVDLGDLGMNGSLVIGGGGTASSLLTVTSTSNGVLVFPRMTTANRNAIATPAEGLMVYDTDLDGLYYFNAAINGWQAVTPNGNVGGSPNRLQDTDNNTHIQVDTAGDGSANTIVFTNNTAESMRLSSGGNLGIGNTSPSQKLDVTGNIAVTGYVKFGGTAGNAPTYIQSAPAADSIDWDDMMDAMTLDATTTIDMTAGDLNFDANTLFIDSSANSIGIGTATPATGIELDVVGDIQYTGTLTDISDIRLKTDITPLDPATIIEKLAQVDTYTFIMKNDPAHKTEYGVMAQEIEKIFPDLVRTADDAMKTKSVNYMGLIAPMIEGVKVLKSENESLKAEIASLKTAQADLIRDVQGLKVHTQYGIQKAAFDNGLILVMMAMLGGMFVLVWRHKV